MSRLTLRCFFHSLDNALAQLWNTCVRGAAVGTPSSYRAALVPIDTREDAQ